MCNRLRGGFATIAVSFVFTGICNEPPDVKSMVFGRVTLWLAIVALASCRGVATHYVVLRGRVLVVGGLSMLPLVLLGLWSFSDDFWVGSGGYCF